MLGAGFVFLTNTITIFGPRVLGDTIDDIGQGLINHSIGFYVGLLLLISLGQGICRFGMRRILIGTSRKAERDLRSLFYDHLLDLPSRFYSSRHTGDIMSRATQDIESVRMMTGPAFMYSIDTVMLGTYGFIMMLSISTSLTGIVSIVLPLASLLVYLMSKKIHWLTVQSQKQFGVISTRVQESVSGIRVIQAYSQEKSFAKSFDIELEKYRHVQIKMVKLQSLFRPVIGLLFSVGQGLVLWQGMKLIIAGSLSLGEYVAFAAYMTMLGWPVVAIGWSMNLFQRGDAGLKRLDEIISHEDRVKDGNSVKDVSGEIVFKNVSFSYNDESGDILSDINITIPAGSVLGIVGPTGSGKSTLLSLLSRLYDPKSGEIYIDGTESKLYTLDNLRKQIANVPQDAFLFSDTLRNNVSFGKIDAADVEVDNVASVSHLDQDLKQFNDGWQSMVGERGISLSGGQKQRSTIARALLVDAKVLILDDCLSAVDTHTEEAIVEDLGKFMHGRTTLISSHRMSVMKWADHIIVLNEGRIIEQGTHSRLVQAGGMYADLHQRQELEDGLETGI
jgi:ATP-binding cassette, subfamily B, multidrug efflux pump